MSKKLGFLTRLGLCLCLLISGCSTYKSWQTATENRYQVFVIFAVDANVDALTSLPGFHLIQVKPLEKSNLGVVASNYWRLSFSTNIQSIDKLKAYLANENMMVVQIIPDNN